MEGIDELKGLNKGYANAKKIIADKTKEYNKLSKQLEILMADLKAAQAFKEAAKLKNDNTTVIAEDGIIKRIQQQIAQLKKPLEELKETIAQEQYNIDSRVNDLRANPEVQKQIDEVLAKKYKEALTKKKEGVTKLTERKARIEEIKKVIKEDPLVERALGGILEIQSEIKDLNKQLEAISSKDKDGKITYTDDAKADDLKKKIEAAEKKNTAEKDIFIKSVATKGLKIEGKDIDELISGKIARDKDGNVLVDKTLSNEEKIIDRQAKKDNKAISDYESMLTKMGVQLPAEKGEQGKPEDPNNKGEGGLPAERKEKWYQKIKNAINRLFFKGREEEPETKGGNNEKGGNNQPDPAQAANQGKENKFIEQLQKSAVFKEAVSRREQELQPKQPEKDPEER